MDPRARPPGTSVGSGVVAGSGARSLGGAEVAPPSVAFTSGQRPAGVGFAHLGALGSGAGAGLVALGAAGIGAAVSAGSLPLAEAGGGGVPAHALNATLAAASANPVRRGLPLAWVSWDERAERGVGGAVIASQGASCRTLCSLPSKRSTARLPSTSVASETGRFQIRTRLAMVSRA